MQGQLAAVVFSARRIAILTSVEGRFLECRNCLLRVQFPAGTHYEVIVKQFESHSCSSLTSSEATTSRGERSEVKCGA
jgi:hypothetical protein